MKPLELLLCISFKFVIDKVLKHRIWRNRLITKQLNLVLGLKNADDKNRLRFCF